MGIALALAAAISWGSSDYLAGHAARQSTALGVGAIAQLSGLFLVILIAPFVSGDPTITDLEWGALAGAADALGLVALYRGLALGPMSIVAPATAGLAAVIPVGIGAALGQSPTGASLAGVMLALIAIVALSVEHEDQPARRVASQVGRSILPTLLAGIGFGTFFVALHQVGGSAGLWPLVAARVTSTMLLCSLLLARRATLSEVPVGPSLAAGALDIAAASAALIAFKHESLPVVAVISSLYPAATIALAAMVAKEHVGARRLAWCGLAIAAVALIAGS